jgi:uncharacterized membrane protein HdeD (DUF308 family)
MNTTEATYRLTRGTTLKTLAGGAVLESVGAVATIALAIAGLAGAAPMTLAAIACIILGAAIVIEGGAFAATHRTNSGQTAHRLEWTETLAAEFLGGLTGIILGVLALLGVAPMTLLGVAVLVFGATFLFSSGTVFGWSFHAIFGLAALILGVLAVVGLSSMVLVLVALACLGASALLSGAATGARMATGAAT